MVSLGCAKNTVDADSMAQVMLAAGYRLVASPGRAHFIIVNTCGFISTAAEESFAALDKLAARKKPGQKLIAAGCLAQRYAGDVAGRVPGIDAILGTRRWMDIADVARGLNAENSAEPRLQLSPATSVGTDEHGALRASVRGTSAYLKIADGCSRTCAFCAIPLIKGPAVSRPLEAIVAEAAALQEKGVREIVLLGQNTTEYGRDLGMKEGLARLLREITSAAPRVNWIRIMYAYPGFVSDELIEVMATRKQVVPYLDMPLQHAHRSVLGRMRRPTNTRWVYETLAKMRRALPGLALRSTFIVGYPGEGEAEFQSLLDFVEEMRFDRLGAFKFSLEAGTASEALGDTVPEGVKEERLGVLMEKQQNISLALNRGFIGRELEVLIEGAGEGISVGRSYRDAPEVDGLVLVRGEIPVGKMVSVRITGATVYDLSGELKAD